MPVFAQPAVEANFDGLVGPTHNYGGLSEGNIASARNAGAVSSPKDGALQGLGKMRRLIDAGFVQGVLPPHERPFLPGLRAMGFSGSDKAVWEAVWKQAPVLGRNMASASAMWAANAATVSPSPDTSDRRVHFTPANLVTTLHRSIEARQTERALKAIFPEPSRFAIHRPLHPQSAFADEGAANHVRLCAEHGAPGVELFVFGRGGFEDYGGRFPARQTREACEAIARAHGLDPRRVVIARQSQLAIQAGAFHNDVVCVGEGPVLFFHEMAFEDKAGVIEAVRRAADGLFDPVLLEVPDAEVPISDAVTSYLFNSQLLTWPGAEHLLLLAPRETEETASTRTWCERMLQDGGPIGEIEYAEVRQSMRNGGGPACLRLRVVLTDADHAKVNPRALLDAERIDTLERWVETHYRDSLAPEDLRDPALIDETRRALDALTQILGLGSDFYPFQRS